MKYVGSVFFSSLLLVGCSSIELAPEATTSSSLSQANVVKSLSVNPRILALNEQLQRDYAITPVTVLRVGNELKLTYPSDMLFGVGGETLLSDSQASLDLLLSATQHYPQAIFRVDCFTDNSGSADKNIARSEMRAQSVATYLLSHHIPADQLSFKGYGSDYPVADNDTPEERASNRRVVITIKVPPAPALVPQNAA